jgi:hypothetical protein
MFRTANQTKRRRLWLVMGGMAAISGIVGWHGGWRSVSWAQEPIGWMYHHEQSEYPFEHLGDVPPDLVVPRSMGDIRVRQFDELDRPRIAERLTHRGAELKDERVTVVAMTGAEDAELALEQFSLAWNEFARLADNFTDTHRNPDFGIGQLLVVIDNEYRQDRPGEDEREQETVKIQNGQTIVHIDVSENQPPLEEQLDKLHQGAVHAFMHLAELDRKFPIWAQQGLANYTALKLEEQEAAANNAAEHADDALYQMAVEEFAAEHPTDYEEPEELLDSLDDEEGLAPPPAPTVTGLSQVGTEYWRLTRVEQDQLAEPDEELVPSTSDAYERVRFLLEGEDAKYAPAFLLALRELAEEPTDPALASREFLQGKQLLPVPTDTILDELADELEPAFREWQADRLIGQPLLLPGGELPDPEMLVRGKEMEVVLKLAQKAAFLADHGAIQPRITEFTAEGQREVSSSTSNATALHPQQLFDELTSPDATPWATLDDQGELLLWTDPDRLADVLGLDENRYTSTYRDGHWVLVTAWDNATQLEAWLETNPNNPSRPLMKFASQPRE